MLMALKSAHKAHSMSFYRGMINTFILNHQIPQNHQTHHNRESHQNNHEHFNMLSFWGNSKNGCRGGGVPLFPHHFVTKC